VDAVGSNTSDFRKKEERGEDNRELLRSRHQTAQAVQEMAEVEVWTHPIYGSSSKCVNAKSSNGKSPKIYCEEAGEYHISA